MGLFGAVILHASNNFLVSFGLKISLFQALIASYISKDDYMTVRDITHFSLKVLVTIVVSLCLESASLH